MFDQSIIALVGISGVGKTTFLKSLSAQLDFQHLTAGSLIARAREAPERSRDELRFADVNQNQRLLIEGFDLACERLASYVILDGHCIIHDGLDVQYIESQVFSELGIDIMVHLEAYPQQIQVNRNRDCTRDRPFLEIDELASHQLLSLSHAQTIAMELNIEFRQLTHDDSDVFLSAISALKDHSIRGDRGHT